MAEAIDIGEVTAFIGARLDEEQEANDKVYGSWRATVDGQIVDHSYAAHVAVGPHGGKIDDDSRAHILRYGPERALRHIRATRRLVAEITARPHDYNDGDPWFSCAQAVVPGGDGEPGSACADDDRAGKPCDCGRDAWVGRMLGIVASEWDDHAQYKPEWKPEG